MEGEATLLDLAVAAVIARGVVVRPLPAGGFSVNIGPELPDADNNCTDDTPTGWIGGIGGT